MRKIELLAPAGSVESLYAAVQAGADAVYMGGSKFSARAYANNFDDEQLKEAINYCHLYGVKVYITVNTLIKEEEIKEAIKYIGFLYSIGVDALIIQDTGIAKLIKEYFSDFEIHASTQMTVHNGEGAIFLKELGFKRIVLSRELSLKEIEYISKDLDIETEIFVHGALCICYSGQCLMSSILGGRSGNRGRCAQPCRLPYTLINEKDDKETKGYLLSPKDICNIENMEDLIKAGATSFKIEGRMKRPEYVAGVVRSYRKAIDAAINKENFEEEQNKKELMQLFNREGFSKAYLYGNKGKDMMAYFFPKNTGLPLGKVNKDKSIKLEENLKIKDGIRNGDKGFIVSSIIKNNKEIEKAYKGDLVKIKPSNYKFKDQLYKTSDTELLQSLGKIYEDKFNKKIYLEANVDFKIGEKIKLNCSYNGEEYSVEGEEIQEALKKPLSMEKIEENLMKSGKTPLKINKIKFNSYEEGFLPVSEINNCRRILINSIEEKIIQNNPHCGKEKEFNVDNIYSNINRIKENDLPKYIFSIYTDEQLKAVVDNGFKNIIVDLFTRNPLNLHKIKGLYQDLNIYLKAPNIIKSEFHYVEKIIEENLHNIKGIVTANLGIVNKFNNRTEIIGDYKLNIFNSFAGDFYKDFIKGSCLSIEINKKEIKSIVKHMNLDSQMLIYGKIENMVSEYCPIGSTFGDKNSYSTCNKACEKGIYTLKDRMSVKFPVKTDIFCRSHIYNNLEINLIGNIEELRTFGINSFRLDFLEENYGEVEYILKSLKEEKWKGDFKNYTRGHYKRGVE
ncbi:U32 family peptidase [Clostridium botulinum]|uniref:U32 family peptidase n=1 Tax=Clostridium botulinum TaxID=1491 RepID=A0A846HUZ5_CLOBO|nr:U32 family peptidase [Clostridium botulinum]AJE13030.1 peptidase U32 family protein [Clostridium botulinum CDC_1436]AXG93271.1 U32 family peptidase [Clostridium botulinum]NEZ91082.1 U32 family peptidase [Clostridium botulinum]NFB31523.1 U32 family peptidase [Clostridium botulinum]